MMNLLTDSLFRVVTEKGPERLSLPALLAGLGKRSIRHLVGIQRHQHDAFHVFLCYLAGAVLARSGSQNPVQDEAFWQKGLLGLTGKVGDDAWQLISDSDTKPAFMQPPLLGDKRKPSSVMNTPDQLDLLVTTKDHDLKMARATAAEMDIWIYALINLQTADGYHGVGNHGISRMNSGFGNRAVVELCRDRRLCNRWIDAVERLIEHREYVLGESFGYDPTGLVLVWIKPWDGNTSLRLSDLDPFYIEICRRIRLRGSDIIESAEFYPSRQPRISAGELKGVVGDPWLPVDLKGGSQAKDGGPKALTFPPMGITAEHMRRLLFEDGLQTSVLQKPSPGWKDDLWLSASVLVRGQGITEGFHSWEVQIPEQKTMRIFRKSSKRDTLEKLSREAIDSAAKMQYRILKPAIYAYVLGAPEKLDLDDPYGNSAWSRTSRQFEALWSLEYFPWLFSVPESFDYEKEHRRWVEILQQRALRMLQEVEEGMAVHSGRQYRARTEARSRFWGGFYKNFEFMRRDRNEDRAGS